MTTAATRSHRWQSWQSGICSERQYDKESLGFEVKFTSRQISELDLADDIVLLEKVKKLQQLLLEATDDKADKVGYAVSVNMTKSF